MTVLTLDAATTALVVVDMQNDFCHPQGYYAGIRDISALQAAVAPNRLLLDRARQAGMTIAFTRLVYDAAHGPMEERHAVKPLRWSSSGRRLIPGSWGAAVVDALAPLPGEIVVDKAGYSAFHGTTLEQDLRDRGVRTVLLSGVVTYACVLATGFGAFDRDFDVILVNDAVGSWSATLGGSTGEIVDLLLGRSLPGDSIAFTPRGCARPVRASA
ncbi:MAG: cysteine hydrolase [Variibacter sp.]|nr:cysteine hydrolase [Variibacter sp.]